jgi:hypothetical protein
VPNAIAKPLDEYTVEERANNLINSDHGATQNDHARTPMDLS